MSIECYVCGEKISPKKPNTRKVAGVWIHKMCPLETARRKARKEAKNAKRRSES